MNQGTKQELSLTESPIFQALMGLSLPIMASSFFATAYNLTDMAWIGSLGASAVAGIGSAGMYLWLSYGLCTLGRMGGQVWTGQMLGRRDIPRAQKFACGAVRLVSMLGLAFALVCIFFARPLIGIFQIKDMQTMSAAVRYLRVVGGFQAFPFLNAVLTGLFTAQGDSRTPLAANTVGLVINMILDPLLVLGIGPFPRLEVMGAATATVTAEVIATLVFLAEQRRKERRGGLHLFSRERIERKIYGDIIRIGLPSALQTSLYTAFSMVLTRLCASFGPAAIAVQRLGGQIESITWNAADGFASAMNSFTAQNYGAQKYDRIRKGYRISFTAVGGWGLLVTAVFLLFARPIAGIFFYEREPVEIFVRYLVIVGIAEAFMAVELMAVGAISGFGETKICSLVSILLTGCRVPLALLFIRMGLGPDGIWWALSLTSICKGIVLDQVFRYIFRRRNEA